MFNLSLSLWSAVAVFCVAAGVIAVAGAKMAGLADRLADRTGWGEAITGTVFLGAITALPGLTASIAAALRGYPSLAISNAIGGIAFQTVILAVADICYAKANLEHAAASLQNIMQTAMLILLLTLVIVGVSSPDAPGLAIHPVSILLVATAGLAFWLVSRVRESPMWKPHVTKETVQDEPGETAKTESLWWLAGGLVALGAVTLICGALIAETAGSIIEKTHLSQAIVGGVFMAAATSLPELVTSIAAVRRGALTLAVSNIVGGNFFDVLFVAAADLAYLNGSLFHAAGVGRSEIYVTSFTILLNVILLSGLIYRQKHGPGNIGFESVLMLVIYVAGFLTIAFTPS